MKSFRAQAIRGARRLFPGAAPFLIPMIVGWGKARADALLRARGLVRGSMIVWPYSGRAFVFAADVARPRGDQVLVRITNSAISPGTERAFFRRDPNAETNFPYFPGYSAAGEVVETGRHVRSVRPGDHVALACGHGSLGLAAESGIVAVPAGVSLEAAAHVQLGVIALQAAAKTRVHPGETTVVLGHGLIGQLLVQIAAALGAYPVIAVARTAKRVTEPLHNAAQRVIALDRDGAEILDGVDARVVFEATGHPDGVALAARCAGKGGRVVLAGSTRGMTAGADFGTLADRSVSLVGAHVTSLPGPLWSKYANIFLTMIAQGRISLAPLISERIHPLEAEWFYRRLARDDDATVGAVFAWDRLPQADRMRPISFLTMPDTTPLKRGRMALRRRMGDFSQREGAA